jgi:hypothetical protein
VDCSGGIKHLEPCTTDADCAPVIHVYHEGIIPGGQYDVRVVFQDCPTGQEASFSPPLSASNPRWGDVTGPFDANAQVWTAPDARVDIVSDAVAALQKFGNRPAAPNKARVDVDQPVPDFKINITDVIRILDAFRGLGYPFTPSAATPCAASD